MQQGSAATTPHLADRIGRFQRPGLARRVFGRQPVDDAVRQVREVLAGRGYSAREPHLTAMFCQMFLLNGSPLLGGPDQRPAAAAA